MKKSVKLVIWAILNLTENRYFSSINSKAGFDIHETVQAEKRMKEKSLLEKHPRNYPMAAILKWHPDHRFFSSFFKIWRRKRIFDNSGIWTRASWIQGSYACHYATLSYMNLWWKIWNTYSKQWKRRQNSNLDEGIHISVILMPFQYGRHWIVAWMLL